MKKIILALALLATPALAQAPHPLEVEVRKMLGDLQFSILALQVELRAAHTTISELRAENEKLKR